jgi:hypothetical protein
MALSASRVVFFILMVFSDSPCPPARLSTAGNHTPARPRNHPQSSPSPRPASRSLAATGGCSFQKAVVRSRKSGARNSQLAAGRLDAWLCRDNNGHFYPASPVGPPPPRWALSNRCRLDTTDKSGVPPRRAVLHPPEAPS